MVAFLLALAVALCAAAFLLGFHAADLEEIVSQEDMRQERLRALYPRD